MNTEPTLSFCRPVVAAELLGQDTPLGRAALLGRLIHPDDIYLFQDGTLSQRLFSEILESYMAGLDLATCLLGFTFVERSIAGRLAHIGQAAAAERTSEELLKEALRRGWLSQEEHATLERLRKDRNTLVHYKDQLTEARPEIWAVMSAKSTPELLASDAKRILQAVFTVLKKTAL